jgi:hypothetical protein
MQITHQPASAPDSRDTLSDPRRSRSVTRALRSQPLWLTLTYLGLLLLLSRAYA